MRLMMRFNLILLLILGVAGLVVSQVAYNFLKNSARRVVMQQAELMMANAQAVRDYTAANVTPALSQSGYHPESVPNFGSIMTFQMLKRKYPQYVYRETAMNARNPEHRPACWEMEAIQWLRDHPDQPELSGERDTASGRVLYLARPIKMEIDCMECHSTPGAAPDALKARWGTENGFGWQEGDPIVGAQIVSVPMTVPVQIASQAYRGLLIYLVVTMVLTMLALDAGVYFFVIRPLEVVSNTANRVSKGEKNVPPLPIKGRDEIAKVNAAFNRMQVSLAKALKMLDTGTN